MMASSWAITSVLSSSLETSAESWMLTSRSRRPSTKKRKLDGTWKPRELDMLTRAAGQMESTVAASPTTIQRATYFSRSFLRRSIEAMSARRPSDSRIERARGSVGKDPTSGSPW
ncbi:MAG: hypothetical protein M0Z34_11965 [Nitrospiraceae bacterium]|nr:hypothetical protein [Nitrospiraceae bacterium]